MIVNHTVLDRGLGYMTAKVRSEITIFRVCDTGWSPLASLQSWQMSLGKDKIFSVSLESPRNTMYFSTLSPKASSWLSSEAGGKLTLP